MVASESSLVERPCPAPTDDARYRAVSLVVERLKDAGFATYLVGGCVRDMAIGRLAKDFDVATAATPEQIESLFEKTIAVGKAFGVMQVASQGIFFEVATFRKDLEYHDGRRPEGVTFCGAEEDVYRRDFRVNGLLFDVHREHIVDHVGGLRDLDARIIRAIGEPSERFREDHLRLLRAIRFSVQLDFRIGQDTWSSICENSHTLEKISRERIRDELLKMLASDTPHEALKMMSQSGCLPHVLPAPDFELEAQQLECMVQRVRDLNLHKLQNRAMASLSAMLYRLAESAELDWEALHISEGSRKALSHHFPALNQCVSQLRLSRSEEHVVMGSVAIAHFVSSKGNLDHPEHVWKRLARWQGASDGFALGQTLNPSHEVSELCERVSNYEEKEYRPVLWVTGQDLQRLGYKPSPAFKEVLRRVENAQLDGAINDRSQAEEFARNLLSKLV